MMEIIYTYDKHVISNVTNYNIGCANILVDVNQIPEGPNV